MKITKMSTYLVLMVFIVFSAGIGFAVDLTTTNGTNSLGLQGQSFMPKLFNQQAPVVNSDGSIGPGTHYRCGNGGVGGNTETDCTNMANDALNAWKNGEYFNQKDGTEWVPATGDHHKTGYRAMYTFNFSAGDWLTGFAPEMVIGQFAPDFGVAGPSDSGLSMSIFLDHPTAPITEGKFPRYLPHARDRQPDTFTASFVSSSTLTQYLATLASFGRGPAPISWAAATLPDGTGCNGMCIWTWTPGGNLTYKMTHDAGYPASTVHNFGPATLENAPFLLDDRLSQYEGGNPQKIAINIKAGSGPNKEGEAAADANEFYQCTSAPFSIANSTGGNLITGNATPESSTPVGLGPCSATPGADAYNFTQPNRIVPQYGLSRTFTTSLYGSDGLVGSYLQADNNPYVRAGGATNGILGKVVRQSDLTSARVIKIGDPLYDQYVGPTVVGDCTFTAMISGDDTPRAITIHNCAVGDIIPNAGNVGIVVCGDGNPAHISYGAGIGVPSCTNGEYQTLREQNNPQDETFLRTPVLHSFGRAQILNQLVQENVQGYLFSCLGCDPANTGPPGLLDEGDGTFQTSGGITIGIATPNPLPPFIFVPGNTNPIVNDVPTGP